MVFEEALVMSGSGVPKKAQNTRKSEAENVALDLHQKAWMWSTIGRNRKMGDLMTVVAQLGEVKRRIELAEAASERAFGQVHLVAVSKTYDGEAIWPVIEAGQRLFGENRVQEAMGKWPALHEKLEREELGHEKFRFEKPGSEPIELHLIGPLQSNKAKEAVATFDVIESVDRDKIAAALASEMKKQGRSLPCYIQVNTGNEPQKAGIAPSQSQEFVARCRDIHGLNVVGLMCIPPADEDPSGHFATLMRLADEAGLPMRSMGMSGDYEAAIAAGATHVRVGSAIFGARPPIK